MSYRFLPEHEAKELLEKYGIKTARCILVEDEEEAVSAAKSIGYPVVMKVAGIIHKSDVGGVILDIKNDEEVRKAFKHLILIPGAKGVTVQPMLPKGIEVIVGVGENEQFGSYVMFGLGGVFVEVLRDVSIRLLPVTREDAKEMIKSIKGFKILSGYRGFKGDIDALTDLIVKLNEIVEKEDIIEMDLNPVFVYERGYAVADARIIKGKRKRFDYKIDDLERLVYPKSVAVIGASRIEGKPGYNIVLNLKRYFKGEIYPINPKADRILDLKCYRSILDIPKDIDLAIIAVPAPFVPQVMKECAEKGVKGVVIISAGFSEEGEEGKKYEEEVLRIARKHGIRVFGPNTTGIMNLDNGLITSFGLFPEIRKGSISIIAQTGLFLGILVEHILTNHPSIGFSKIFGMGNKIDVDDYEVLHYLSKDDKTKVIGIYMEGIRNGRAFYDVAKKSDKAVVVFKSGRTEYGRKAALSHTASICGDDDVFNAVCEQANIIRVYSFEELLDVAKAISLQPPPKGDRIAIIHYTGSGCVQGADAAYLNGLKLPNFDKRTVERIREVTPEWHQINNPIDLWPMVEYHGLKAYDVAIEAVLADENVDSLVVSVIASKRWESLIYRPDFERLKKFKKTIFFVIEGPRDLVFDLKNEYELNGFPVYHDVITAVNVLGKITKWSLRRKKSTKLETANQ